MRCFRTLFLVVFMLPLSALGQESDEMRETTYDFSDDIVEGELVRPDGELIEGSRHDRGSSLITIREHFIDKMIESVEDL